jgi:hypothetical protein
MMLGLALSIGLAVLSGLPAMAQPAVLERALDQAIETFERARPHLASSEAGVDVATYRDALTLQRFSSAHWGGTIRVDLAIREGNGGSCGRYAAFVRLPPENGMVQLVFCPQFFSPDADALRRLTVLHEMVHVVAGPDECRAMAFAARVEQAATGRFTPVEAYWRASGCAGSGFRLPN